MESGTFPHRIIHQENLPRKNNFTISPAGDDENGVFVTAILCM